MTGRFPRPVTSAMGTVRGVLLLALYVVFVLVMLIAAYRQLSTAAGSNRKTARGMLLLTMSLIVTIWVVG
jgi:hypothetical protein